MMTAEQLVFLAILASVAGAGVTLAVARWRMLAGVLALATTALSAGLVGLAAVQALAGWWPWPRTTTGWLAAAAHYHSVQVDGLSAIFLLLAATVAVFAAVYSLHYMRHYSAGVGRYYPFFLLFVAAMYGLLSTADTMWWFLGCWQLMVFSGYVLIRFDRATGREGANRFAIMLELGCAALVAGNGLLAHGAGAVTAYNWNAIGAKLPAVLNTAPGDGALAFVLLLVGFGITMGLWPFGQMWLPQASPGAPTPFSALLFGALIKIGAYGLVRYFLVLPAATPGFPLAGWGMAIALLGTLTLFVGTAQALQQEKTKRLLAFHSIGQMGYVALAVGACMAVAGKPGAAGAAIAGFALMAGLFHAANHSLFSALLYFNVGSVQQATGTQDLNRLGGLMKYMPLTGVTALVGSLAIAGVPLLNGFASKWAIFAATIQGAGSARYLAVCAAIAILTSGITLASFMKFFGASFLSRSSELVREKAALRPAQRGAEPRAHTGRGHTSLEVGWSMQAPQVGLAILCVLLGVVPGAGFAILGQAMAMTPQGMGMGALASATPLSTDTLGGAAGPLGAAIYVPAALLGALGACFLIAFGISKLASAPRRAAAPWLCGYAPEAECERYIAHNFYGELKRHFHWVGGAENGKAAVVKGRAL